MSTMEMPAHKCRQQDLAVLTGDATDLACKTFRPLTSGWPFNAQDVSPLAWWRSLPSTHLRDAEHLLVIDTLSKICVLDHRQNLAAAIRGDTAAAVGAALSVLPVYKVTLTADIAMTALLRCALEGDATTTLVLANILRRVELEHSLAAELSASWQMRLVRGLRQGARRALRRSGFRDSLMVDIGNAHAEGGA